MENEAAEHLTKNESFFYNKDLAKSIADLEVILRRVLPRFMTPSIFIPVKAVPLTKSGKIDRKYLRECASAFSTDRLNAYTRVTSKKSQPTTAHETLLRGFWAKTLQIDEEQIGTQEDFFRIGGDSIQAMRLVQTCRANDFPLTAAAIFGKSKLCEQARLLKSIERKVHDETSPLPFSMSENELCLWPASFLEEVVLPRLALKASDVEDVLPATVFQSDSFKEYCQYSFLQLNRLLDPEAIQDCFGELFRRHQILRTVFLLHEDKCYQVVLRRPNLELFFPSVGEDDLKDIQDLCDTDAELEGPHCQGPVKFMAIMTNG